MPRNYHLFLVEDDTAMRGMLSEFLEKHGMTVTAMSTAEDLLRRIDRIRPDLVILDVMLPGASGLDACSQLRARGDRVPVVMLTARGDETDRVVGLEFGADDYVPKPFSARELLARIHAVLRRTHGAPARPRSTERRVAIGPWSFDVLSRSLIREGEQRPLSRVEFALLLELTANPGVPISRERLLEASHGRADNVLDRAVDVAIMRLRRVVEPQPNQPRFIQTVRQYGYVFTPAPGELAQ
jgi:two-component system phosphate regulon response regulator OmpR